MALRFGVERRGRLVEDQHGRVFQDRARDGQALALAAGQPEPALADERVQPLGHFPDEAHRVGRLGGGDDVALARAAHCAIGDIREDRVVEEDDFLAHQRDIRAQALERQRLDVVTVEQHPAGARHIEARQEVDQRGLAAARAAHQRHRFAGLDVQVDVDQRRLGARFIGEVHAFVCDAPAGAGKRPLAPILLDRRVDHAEHAFRGGQPALQRRIELGEALDRRQQHEHGGHEGRELADRGAIGDRVLHRDIDDDRQRDRGERVRHRRGERLGDDQAHVEAAQRLVCAQEAVRLVVLPAEDLDHLVAFDRFLQHVHHPAHRAQRPARHLAQPPGKQADEQGDDRHDGKRDEGQPPVEIEQPGEQPDHRDRILDGDGDHGGRRADDAGDVVGHFRQQRAGALLVEMPGREAYQPRKHRRAQIEHHPVPDPLQAERRQESQNSAHEKNADDRPGEYRGRVARRARRGEPAVEQRLDERGEKRLGRRGADHAQHGQREHPGMRPDVGQQPQVQLSAPLAARLRHGRIVPARAP